MCFIVLSTPLRLGCSGLSRSYAEKQTAGDCWFFELDYTQARPISRLEICIGQIRFSDEEAGEPSSLIVLVRKLPGPA